MVYCIIWYEIFFSVYRMVGLFVFFVEFKNVRLQRGEIIMF